MSNKSRASTKEIPVKGFNPHGSMELEVSGQLNVMEAIGPFNVQLVLAGDVAQQKLDAELQQKGRWATMLIFRESALASFEVLTEIEGIVRRRMSQGLCPVGVALVLGNDVEGATLMRPLYLKAYVNAGVLTRVFDNVEDGKAWLQSLLANN